MKKICFITAARSEYGLLKWLMRDVYNSSDLTMQLIVTGGHLTYSQGHTVEQIINDGFTIDEQVNVEIDTTSVKNIAASMGKMAQEFSEVFDKLKPDYVLVLGDRYELLPICNTAFVMGIPIIHLSGGDVTEGAIDDGIRNAVTMLAEYHFPGTSDSAKNIIRMRGSDKNVWAVGEPGLDSFQREKLLSRADLADGLGLDITKKWGLMTYHPETKRTVEYNLANVKYCLDALLEKKDYQTVVTYANMDFGGQQINSYIEKIASSYPNQIKAVPSLGQLRYLSFMKQSKFVIGNSSSGIIEAPFLNILVINIGDRQKGRYQCGNVIQCSGDKVSICKAVHNIDKINIKDRNDMDYWGDGHTSERILSILENELD